jgi:hypothetical protein
MDAGDSFGAVCRALEGLGVEVLVYEDLAPLLLRQRLERDWREGPFELIFERNATACDVLARFAEHTGTPRALALDVRPPGLSERIWRGVALDLIEDTLRAPRRPVAGIGYLVMPRSTRQTRIRRNSSSTSARRNATPMSPAVTRPASLPVASYS